MSSSTSNSIPVTLSDRNIFQERGYVFKQLLGEGSYAKVWLVKYVHTSEKNKEYSLACKIIDSRKAPKDFVHKFLPREMDILNKINHPHLIHLHCIYQIKTKFFIFMRYAEKGDLLDHILAKGEIAEIQARLWIRQLSLGLQYLHNLEIVHRDIKCENVLITVNNNVKLADFGFSRFMVDASGKRYLSSTYCGSLAYAAPELLKGKPYDPKRCDVWSLGVVLYVMLNQCMPFNDADMKKLYELQMNNKWSFRSKIAPIITEDVKILVRSMLQPDLTQRLSIEDVVNHSWFTYDYRLKVMSQKEKGALELGMINRSGMIPKSQKLSVPSWKKRKKDEQVVCVTELRFECSSDEFCFDVMGPPPDEAKIKAPKNKSEDDMKSQPKQKSSTTTPVKPQTTSSTAAAGPKLSNVSRTEKFMSVTETPTVQAGTSKNIQPLASTTSSSHPNPPATTSSRRSTSTTSSPPPKPVTEPPPNSDEEESEPLEQNAEKPLSKREVLSGESQTKEVLESNTEPANSVPKN